LFTQHAILDIVTNTYDQLNQGKNVGLVFFRHQESIRYRKPWHSIRKT